MRIPLPDTPTDVTLVMYVDDGKLYMLSQTLESNVRMLKIAYEKAENWLQDAGLSADPSKRELMHYSRH